MTDDWGTIGGGLHNRAGDSAGTLGDSIYATVAGGASNTASGWASIVPGGLGNTAGGDYSFAAGRRAQASHIGAFVWADSTNADFASTDANQFNVRASRGARIFSNFTATVGVQLTPGGNSWSVASDRNVKENFTRLDPAEVLENLNRIPITRWNLKSQDPSIHHIGPMAQDFYAAFGVGESDRYISTSDADGVAFAATQGLHEMVQEKDCEIAEQEAHIADLRAENAAIKNRLARIEAFMVAMNAATQGGVK